MSTPWPFGSLAPGAQLAQIRPAVTTAVTALAPTLRTEVTSIQVCNTTAAVRTFRLYHDDDGGTFDEGTALYWNVTAPVGQTIEIRANALAGGITCSRDGRIGVRSDLTSGLTFTLYGVVQPI